MEKMRQWTVLTALGVVGVLAAGWFLMVSPQRSHASDLRTQAASEQQATAGLQSQVNQLKQQQKGETAQQRELAKIAAQIPDNPMLPALIRELSSAAHQAGVSLDSLSPSQPTAVAAAAPAPAPVASGTGVTAAPAVAAPLDAIPVVITVTGSYFNIETFMRQLEHLTRALKTSGLTIGPSSGGTAAGAAGSAPNALSGQIQATVYESPSIAPVGTTAQTAAPVTSQSSAPAQSTTGSTTTPAQSGSEQ